MNMKSRVAPVPARPQSGKAGSVILVILLGTFCGAGWAVIDYKKKGGDLDKLRNVVAKKIDDAMPVRIESPNSTGKGGPSATPSPRPRTPAPNGKQPGGTAKGAEVAKNTGMAPDAATEPPAPETAVVPATPAPGAEQPVSVQPVRPATPPVVAAAGNAYGFEEVFTAMRECEADLKVGKIAEARERLVRFETSRVID
jgi:hypothetical protein